MVCLMWKVFQVQILYVSQHHGFVKLVVQVLKIHHVNSALTRVAFLKKQMSENGFI